MSTEKYEKIKRIGEGAYGVVFSALNKLTGEVVAIKKLNGECTSEEDCTEVNALVSMNHPNIIKLKEHIKEDDTQYLIFECMECSLFTRMYRMKNAAPFSESQIRNMSFQLFQGLAHMHGNGYFHRDLKPENLLLSKNVIKIADLGQARETNGKPPYTDYVTTRWYRAPEVLLCSPVYGPAVDMWAMGAIMAELFMRLPLFRGGSAGDMLYQICSVIGSPTESNWRVGLKLAGDMNYQFPDFSGMPLADLLPYASNEALCLMATLLSWNPYMRPTAMEALEHPFFEGCHVNRPIRLS